jgi:transcriptional regulator with XRE-family HTH domain
MSEEKEQFTGEKLKELRKKHGLTQVELSKETYITRTKLSDYENGAKISKSIAMLLKLFFEKKEKLF